MLPFFSFVAAISNTALPLVNSWHFVNIYPRLSIFINSISKDIGMYTTKRQNKSYVFTSHFIWGFNISYKISCSSDISLFIPNLTILLIKIYA